MKRIAIFLAVMAVAACRQEKVEWISTTSEQPWQVLPAKPYEAADAPVLEIDPAKTLHAFAGFGTAASELSWDALSLLPEEERDGIFRELFAPGGGMRLTKVRTPMGASDFAKEFYSYDEVAGDLGMAYFSVERDKQYLLPFLHAAQAANPDLTFWASPWCPPSWMKVNGHYASASTAPMLRRMAAFGGNRMGSRPMVDNGLDEDKQTPEGTDAFILRPEYLKAYAAYFGKYVDAYKENGIDISMVMPQNEPNSNQIFPSCVWTPEGLKLLIAALGPEMDKRGVEVWLGTMERANLGLWDQIVKDPAAGKWIKGLGFQWAGKEALPGMHEAFPDLPCYMTEQECGNGANDWKGAMHSWDLMREYIQHGCEGYFYWNTALCKGEASTWGWRQNSLVLVDRQTADWSYTPEFYVLRHASHFVDPGARVLVPAGSYADALAFLNPGSQIVILAANQDGQDKPVTFRIGRKDRTYLLPAHSLNTITID